MKNYVYSRIYKLCRIFSWLIAFFIGGIFYSMTCHAQAMPTSNTFSVMENTVEQLFNFGFVPQSLMPYGDISTSAWDPWQTGAVLLNFELEDCEISELDNSQKSELLNNFTIVNSSNINVTTTDSIYSVKMDNGYFTGYVYVDENGDILSYTNDLGGQLLQVKFGGDIKSSEDWDDLLSNTSTQIYEANFNLYDNPSLIQGDTSYYYFIGQDYASYPYVAQELYIPNQYQPGVVVPVKNSDGSHIASWYTNNLNLFTYKMVYGDDTRWKALKTYPGTYTQDNISYTYQVTFSGYISTRNTYQNWLEGNGYLTCNFANYGTEYSSTLYNNASSSVAFKPLQLPDGSTIINYNYYYDPTEISRLEQQLNDLQSLLNNQFNSSQQLSDENFPFYYPTGDTEISPSEIPFPNVINYPNFNPLPSLNTDPNLQYQPEVQPTPEEVETSINNFGIPFFQNLQYKYPFSIPWDIKAFINSFKAEPTPPAWDFDWNITVGNTTYTHHFEGDLSEFNSLAEIFRNLLLISFIIGLCVFSYNHHF